MRPRLVTHQAFQGEFCILEGVLCQSLITIKEIVCMNRRQAAKISCWGDFSSGGYKAELSRRTVWLFVEQQTGVIIDVSVSDAPFLYSDAEVSSTFLEDSIFPTEYVS